MRLRRHPALLSLVALLVACSGGHRPLGTIEPVPGSRTREGGTIVPIDTTRPREIRRLDAQGREIAPVDSTVAREIRPLDASGNPPREIRRLGDTTRSGVRGLREVEPTDTLIVPLDSTTWQGANYEGEITLEFLVGGILRYTTGNGTFSNGTWQQDGNAVTFEMNSHFADWTGRIRGTRMSGTGQNRAGRRWDWQATRQ